MKEEEESGTHVSVSEISIQASQESLSPPLYRRTWGNDEYESKRQSTPTLGRKSRWSWTVRDHCVAAYRRVVQTMQVLLELMTKLLIEAVQTTPILLRWIMNVSITMKQFIAFLMVLACGITPFFILAFATTASYPFRPFYWVFADKVLRCGEALGNPQNSTVSGIEKLFVLDNTFGHFTFSQVKLIDVLWDLVIGRGTQLCAWWVAYIVFSDALLRVIERHPASFRIFQRIALEGPSLLSLWSLLKELWLAKDRKTSLLFCYMWISTTYVLCIPIFLGAMTGYDATTIAWLDLDDTNNIVPWSMMQETWLMTGTKNETFAQAVCKPYEMQWEWSRQESLKYGQCDCQLPNGTVIDTTHTVFNPNCTFDFPGATQTFSDFEWVGDREIRNCNSTFNIEVHGKNYPAHDLKTTYGYCFGDVGYNATYLYDKTRCLPDTANPAYQWGFATMLSGLFVFVQFGWCLSMYVVWQDAQFNCTLIKEGYKMIPLRAAFAMAKAAQRKTGMDEKELIRADTKDLEEELYGGRSLQAAQVDQAIFYQDSEDDGADTQRLREEGLRARHRQGLSEAAFG